MGDASPAPGGEDMGSDMMGGEMPNGEMPADPGMDGGMPMDPGMDGEMPEAGGEPNDETMEIINKLSEKDKEAVKSYAESLISKDETSEPEMDNQDILPQDGLNMEAPMNETFIFKKGQLNKLMENFGPTEDELENEKRRPNLVKKQKNKENVKNSPFKAPDFV